MAKNGLKSLSRRRLISTDLVWVWVGLGVRATRAGSFWGLKPKFESLNFQKLTPQLPLQSSEEIKHKNYGLVLVNYPKPPHRLEFRFRLQVAQVFCRFSFFLRDDLLTCVLGSQDQDADFGR